MCCPPCSAGNSKNGSKEVRRNPQGIVNGGGIEIDIRIEVLLFEHQLGYPIAHFDPLWFPNFLAESLGHLFQMRSARVQCFIYPMSNPHNFLFIRQGIFNESIDLLERP